MISKLLLAVAFWATLSPTHALANDDEINCLALNVYHESRGEEVEGQIAVANVTMNRVEHDYWPDNVCEVVYQKNQFSWVHLIKDHTPREEDAWLTAYFVALNVYDGLIGDTTNDSVFYHANWINPSWASKHHTVEQMRLGVHIFYSWKGYWS